MERIDIVRGLILLKDAVLNYADLFNPQIVPLSFYFQQFLATINFNIIFSSSKKLNDSKKNIRVSTKENLHDTINFRKVS